MSQLRRIAIWVQETETGAFRWVLTEVKQGRLRDLRSSEHEFLFFEGALDEGADALKNMSADLSVGPRDEIEEQEPQLGLFSRSLRWARPRQPWATSAE